MRSALAAGEGHEMSDPMDLLTWIVDKMRTGAVDNYVLPGLASELVGGSGNGCVRLLSADRHTRDWVTPHSHRFDFACLVLAGEVENILFGLGIEGDFYLESKVRPLDGGMGRYEMERGERPLRYVEHPKRYAAGTSYSMTSKDIHSIRFSRGARVLFFEGPTVSDTSTILEPWCNGNVVPTFETRPWMFAPRTSTAKDPR